MFQTFELLTKSYDTIQYYFIKQADRTQLEMNRKLKQLNHIISKCT